MTPQILYRSATVQDATAIAMLHAQSWREHYRGIWTDAFLDTDVVPDRQQVWTTRLEQPSDNQYIILAETEGQLVGFVCIYLRSDTIWGSLVDNLHVKTAWQGQGIGQALLAQALNLAHKAAPETGVYLWVLKDNKPAIGFYDRQGGRAAETVLLPNPDGEHYWCCRYVWH